MAAAGKPPSSLPQPSPLLNSVSFGGKVKLLWVTRGQAQFAQQG